MIREKFRKINQWLWEAPREEKEGMRVPARIYASSKILQETEEEALKQLISISKIPGIVSYALAMPDIHSGYGPPIGGVGAIDKEKGIISPSFIGFDENCGVRVLTSGVKKEEIKKHIDKLSTELYRKVPSGVGQKGSLKLSSEEMEKVLQEGFFFLASRSLANQEDIRNCEDGGKIKDARPDFVSEEAKKRGREQLGTLGSGNHFLEIQEVEKIFNKEEARKMGLFEQQVVFMIHTGSRGLGHQNCGDYLKEARKIMGKYDTPALEKELLSFPFNSPEGKRFFGAMSAACNFAFANRQVITESVRKAFHRTMGRSVELKLLYDVAHNIAKIEKHEIAGKEKELLVHRKGATRAFPGQPVIIPGSMGTSSYILVGREKGKDSFYSVSHGAGRRLSRKAAKKRISGKETIKKLERKGIIVKCGSTKGISEEAPETYKDIEEVVEVIYNAGLSERVAKLKPIAVIKGE